VAPRARRAVLGGTFDRLHEGHLALLDAAFAAAPEVHIGLTTDRYLAEHPKPLAGRIRPYAQRYRDLRRTLTARYPGARSRLVPIDDRFGGSLRPGLDLLVLSEETASGGRAVNRARARRGLPPLQLVVIPRVLAEDLGPIEGRRIRAREIDRRGRRLGPLEIAVSADTPTLARALRALARSVWPRRRLRRSLGRRGRRVGVVRLTATSRSAGSARVRLAGEGGPWREGRWDLRTDPPDFGGLGPLLPALATRGRRSRPAGRASGRFDNH
jgi:pantetheine-phosphate adenylyltransferase